LAGLGLTTDRGTQFTSALWSSTCMSLGIKHVPTTAYHPQSNGMVERLHRQLKDALRYVHVGRALHGTPIFQGCCWAYVPPPRRILQYLHRSWSLGHHWFFLDNVPPPPTRPLSYAAAANTPPAHLAKAEYMYVQVGGQQKPLAAPYAGPFLVLSKGAKTFTIQVGQRQEIVSVDRLKPHTGLGPVSPAVAASRGRPPKMPAAPSIQPASS
jgi:hypothetical protein